MAALAAPGTKLLAAVIGTLKTQWLRGAGKVLTERDWSAGEGAGGHGGGRGAMRFSRYASECVVNIYAVYLDCMPVSNGQLLWILGQALRRKHVPL